MRVAGGPGVVAEGAVRPAGHLVEQRQVARGRRLVHDDRVDRSGNDPLFSVVWAAVCTDSVLQNDASAKISWKELSYP